MSGAIVAGVGLSLVGGLFKSGAARRAKRNAARQKRLLTGELKAAEKGRQKITNPYEGTTNLSALAKDLSGKLSNPFANLGVSTAAAEIQIEEADIALANTLDTLRSTGAGAGGATALAQAALQSKKGVAASIEQQEAQNEKLKAQGKQQLEQLQLQEAQRIQGVQIAEGRRVQTADAAGKAFMFNAQERREGDKINYLRGKRDAAEYREYGAAQRQSSAIGDMFGSLGSSIIGLN